MRVYLQPPQQSRGLQRIADALTRYAPATVEVTPFHDEADFVVIYAIGRRERIWGQTRHLLERGKQYAIVQVCLRSTMSPDSRDWAGIWKKAAVVWGYYDLEQAAETDELGGGAIFKRLVNFLHAPLGVDSSVFYPREKLGNYYIIATSGLSRLQESVRECVLAAKEVDGAIFHLGRQVKWDDSIHYSNDCDDNELARQLSICEFVSGLRRKEGFELPAAEGLLCGSRPIVFNTPDYHFNYKNWAEYIEETDRQGVIDQLVQLFKQGARPVTQHEREEAAHWFNWERICGEFWQRCLR